MHKFFLYKKALSCIGIILSLLLIISCKDDDEKTVGGFNVDQTELLFMEGGGTLDLKIATDEAWVVESNNDWCTVSPASGQGSGVCHITAKVSELYDKREAFLYFIAESGKEQEVAIKQYGYAPSIDLTEESVTIPSYAPIDEAYVDVEVMANIPLKVIIPEEQKLWLSIEGEDSYTPSTTQPKKKKFRFKFKTYTDFSTERMAEVEFVEIAEQTRAEETASGLKKILTIIQERAPKIIPSREGDSLAILSISRQLDMYGVSWPTSRPITHWDNVLTEPRTYMYDDGENPPYERTELRVVGVSFSMFMTDETIPYQIQYLTELETFAATSNANSIFKKIDLGPEITKCTKLRSLSLMGYGICSFPAEFENLQNLEELDMNGNTFCSLPVVLKSLPKLKYLNFGANRICNVNNLKTDIPDNYTLETIGMTGEIPSWVFTMNQLEYLYLSYNYFYGDLPTTAEIGTAMGNPSIAKEEIMPNLKVLALNLNRFTGNEKGTVPDWILFHKNLICWNPFILLFNQEGYDHNGVAAGFPKAPMKIADLAAMGAATECPDDDEEELQFALGLPELTENEVNSVPLHGHWRYYRGVLKKTWKYLDK